jgi:hypothetical protein
MRFRSLSRFGPACGLAVASATCACVDLTGVGDFGGRLVGIEVWAGTSSVAVVQVGDTTRLSVLGRVGGLLGLFSYDRVLDATWRSSDPGIARVEKLPPVPPADSTTPAQVLVRGVAPGTARVTAAARGIVGSIEVRVVAPATASRR